MPPYPKADGERVRRNVPTFSWVVLPREGRRGSPPPLPSGREWSQGTVDWWGRLWAAPQAVMWPEDDPELHRLALLHEVVWSAKVPSATLLAEMRQIEDRHGLNPKALLQLRWRVADEESPVGSGPRPSRRQGLKLVDRAG